jgi:hypothetical protein
MPDHELARRLLESESGGSEAPAEIGAAGERVLQRLHENLARWFGRDAIHALLTRALAEARDAHPALADVEIAPDRVLHLKGLTARSTNAGDAVETTAAVIALITSTVAILTRLIGEDMVARLLHQLLTTDPRDEARGNTAAGDRMHTRLGHEDRGS